jgi:hypothetical protein
VRRVGRAAAAHGLKRSNKCKRNAVMTLLNDPEWSQWSDGEIARRCAVTLAPVNRVPTSDPLYIVTVTKSLDSIASSGISLQ